MSRFDPGPVSYAEQMPGLQPSAPRAVKTCWCAGVRGQSLVGQSLGGRRNAVERLLGRRAQVPVGTEPTVIAGLGIKLARLDAIGDILHLHLSLVQLKFVANGGNRAVLFQVVELQAVCVISPLLLRGQGVDRELQTVVGILLGAWFSGFVVNNRDPSIAQIVDPVDSAGDGGVAYSHLEVLLCV